MRTSEQSPLRVARTAAEIRGWIVEQVAQSLKVYDSEVDPAAPLDSLGIDSLTAIGMTGGLAAYLGRDVPATLMWDYATINAIAEGLADPEASRQAAARRGIVNLQPLGDRTPIFFFPGLGGHPVTFNHVASHLGTSQPCYGLTVPGFDGDEQPLTSVEEIATVMVQTLRSVQPEGPYRLAGYSFGGFLAYEAARQLTAAGQTVDTLAIYDTFAPDGRVSRPLWQRLALHGYLFLTRRNRMAYLADRFHQLASARKRKKASAANRALAQNDQSSSDPLPEEKLKLILDLNQQAVNRYRPLPYPGSLVMFLANVRPEYNRFYKIDPHGGWAALCGGQVRVIPLDGDHFTLLDADHAAYAAEMLKTCLADFDH